MLCAWCDVLHYLCVRILKILFWIVPDIQLSLHCIHSCALDLSYVRSNIICQRTPSQWLWPHNGTPSRARSLIDLNSSSSAVLATFWYFPTFSDIIADIGFWLRDASILTDSRCRSEQSRWENLLVALRQFMNPPLVKQLFSSEWQFLLFSFAAHKAQHIVLIRNIILPLPL